MGLGIVMSGVRPLNPNRPGATRRPDGTDLTAAIAEWIELRGPESGPRYPWHCTGTVNRTLRMAMKAKMHREERSRRARMASQGVQ